MVKPSNLSFEPVVQVMLQKIHGPLHKEYYLRAGTAERILREGYTYREGMKKPEVRAFKVAG